MFVPGDRVAIAFDPSIPEARPCVAGLVEVLDGAGVDPGGLTIMIVVASAGIEMATRCPAEDESWSTIPDDRTQIAYLANTKEGRRVYLNRLLTDADVVVPVGRLGYDPTWDFAGPGARSSPD